VSARALKRNLITIAADAGIHDTEAGAVHGNEVVDLAVQSLAEQFFHTAQVAVIRPGTVRQRMFSGSIHF
jgi:hypothetical protein